MCPDATTERAEQTGEAGQGQQEAEPMLIDPDFAGSAEAVRMYRGMYTGQRCFIVGNGPSLRASDLDRIHELGDYSFGCNRIYLMFGDTAWRPDVYTCSDEACLIKSKAEIDAIDAELKIIPVCPSHRVPPIKDALHARFLGDDIHSDGDPLWTDWLLEGKLPPFSDDISRCIFCGKTITYVNIQIAVYLGFKELILIGVDHSYSKHSFLSFDRYARERATEKAKGEGVSFEFHLDTTHYEGVTDHFCPDYQAGIQTEGGYYIRESTRAYQAARQYAAEHGIRIVNATRGGKLEVFKRVDLDTLL